MVEHIGIETYFDNNETGVTWFYNDMEITHEELLKFLNHVTNNEQYEITTDADNNYVLLKDIKRNENSHFDTFGCFVWGETHPSYPAYSNESMTKTEIIENDGQLISTFIRHLIRYL